MQTLTTLKLLNFCKTDRNIPHLHIINTLIKDKHWYRIKTEKEKENERVKERELITIYRIFYYCYYTITLITSIYVLYSCSHSFFLFFKFTNSCEIPHCLRFSPTDCAFKVNKSTFEYLSAGAWSIKFRFLSLYYIVCHMSLLYTFIKRNIMPFAPFVTR